MSEVKKIEEVLISVIKLGGLMVDVFKDGAQAEDVLVIFEKIKSEPELSKGLLDLYNSIDAIKGEAKDLDLGGAIDLAKVVVPELIEVYKKIKA